MNVLRYVILILVFLITYQSISVWAELAIPYDETWWKRQYAKIYDTPHCREIITNMDKIRAFDKKTGLLSAPMTWAVGMYSAKGECAEPAIDEALEILSDLAKRGEGYPSVLLAQFLYIEHGADAPATQTWMERAKNAMARIIIPNWRSDFYQSTAAALKKAGTPFSPQLERHFLWAEDTLNGNPDAIYKYGLNLVERGAYPEDKVLGCRWLYEAEKRGHAQARFRLARQHILGEGVQKAPNPGSLWLYKSVNQDRNEDALVFASKLLKEGGVYKGRLTSSYIALLWAQKVGADVSNELESVRSLMSPQQIERATRNSDTTDFRLNFYVSPDLKLSQKSGIAPNICKFIPE